MLRVSTSDFFRGIRRGALGLRMLLSVSLIVSLYLAISTSENEDSLYWPSWYILRLNPGADLEWVEEALRDMGVEEVISEASADVAYMAIPDLERASVAELEKYLVPGDPRRDPYISNVSRLFESNGSPLVYIRAKRGLFHYKTILERQEEIPDWHLMDWRGIRALLDPLILIAMAVLATLFGSVRGRRLARFISSIPLAVFVFLITPNTIIPVILAFYLSPNALRVGSRPYAHRIIIYFGYALALASAFLAYDKKYLSLLAVLVSELVYLVLAGTSGNLVTRRAAKKNEKLSMRFRMRRAPNRDHRLFIPVPLLQKHEASKASDFHGTVFGTYKIRSLFLTAFLLLVFLIPESAPITHDPLPYARKSAKSFDDLEAMELLDENRSSANLPDISLLMASVAYQEGFLFGAVFRLPRLNESLVMQNYLQVGDAIESMESTVVEYDQTWYRQKLSTELEIGVGRLFASLGGPSPVSEVTRQPIRGKGWDDALTAILWAIAFIAIFILALIPVDGDAHVRQTTGSLIGGEKVRAA